jgi:hypothetical protein
VHLEELTLTGTGIGDVGIKHLAKLPKLRVLDLTGTAVTAAGLQELRALQTLEVVALPDSTALKVKDLRAFQMASRLRSIYVKGKALPPTAIAYARGTQKISTGLALGGGQAPVRDSDPLQQITLVDAKPATPYRFSAGLRHVHEMESALDHDMPAVETPHINSQTDTQENFLGEINVDVGRPAKP